MLEITTFYNDMILSTLSISSRGFALGLPTIIFLNKVYHRASLEVYVAPEQPPLNQGSTPSLEPSNKVHVLFDTLVTFLLLLRGSQFFVQYLRILLSWLV